LFLIARGPCQSRLFHARDHHVDGKILLKKQKVDSKHFLKFKNMLGLLRTLCD
jgi:hypothetical protein